MSFYADSELIYSPEYAALDAAGNADAIALWALAGSWCSAHVTGGLVGKNFLKGRHKSAEALVGCGLWTWTACTGFEFAGASAAYEVAMSNKGRRPTDYVHLLHCKMPSKAAVEWARRAGLNKARPKLRRLRAAVIAAHGMTCWLCKLPIETEGDLHLDHVKPRVLGGDDSPKNLRPAHARCNTLRGTKEVG